MSGGVRFVRAAVARRRGARAVPDGAFEMPAPARPAGRHARVAFSRSLDDIARRPALSSRRARPKNFSPRGAAVTEFACARARCVSRTSRVLQIFRARGAQVYRRADKIRGGADCRLAQGCLASDKRYGAQLRATLRFFPSFFVLSSFFFFPLEDAPFSRRHRNSTTVENTTRVLCCSFRPRLLTVVRPF